MVRLSQHSFAGGQMDYELMGRQDYSKYAKAASRLENFRITKRGALTKRLGFHNCQNASVADRDAQHRLVSFAYTTDIGFVLLFKGGGITAYKDAGDGVSSVRLTLTSPATYYSADDINDLSICQVGFKLFIAHRDYHPQVITLHEASLGVYSFELERLDFSLREDASKIPSIASATLSRTQIARDQACGTFTEEYKVTAVYDGVETTASEAFRNESGFKSQAHGKPSYSEDFKPGKFTGATTTYYLPWTTSQSITLKVNVPDDADEVRLYKKSFGVFGLIGVTSFSSEVEEENRQYIVQNQPCSIEEIRGTSTTEVTDPEGGSSTTTSDIIIQDEDIKYATATSSPTNGVTYYLEINDEQAGSATASGSKWSIPGDLNVLWQGKTIRAPFGSGTYSIYYEKSATNTSSWTFVDKNYVPDTGVTPPEPLDDFCKTDSDYPGIVCYSQQRLIWASSKRDPNRIWMSQVGDFYTFSPHERMVTDDPIDFELPIKEFPNIRHIKEMKDIIVFTDAAEWVIDSASTTSGITFETIRARAHGNIGSDKGLPPIACNNILLFAERSGRAVRALSYDAVLDGIGSEDVSILSSAIFENNPITDWVYQQFPYGELWCTLADGTMASFTYMPEQKVAAWGTHKISKTKVLRITSSRRLNGGHESVFATVQGEPSGDIYLVKMALPSDTGAYSDRPGLGGTGVDIESVFTSTFPAIAGDAIGLGQFDIKDLVNVGLRLSPDSQGGAVRCEGIPDAAWETIRYGDRPEETDGVTIGNIKPRGFNARDGRVTIRQNFKYPFTLLMYEADYAVEAGGEQ